MRLRLLGVPQVLLETWQPLRPSNHAALLCYLAYRGAWVTRDEAALLFYPEVSTSAARTKFRQLLRRAKKLPGGEGLETTGERLRLVAESDVGALREALGRGDWGAASEAYRGTLLDGFDLRDAPGFESWLDLERAALHTTWREAALKHAATLAEREAFKTAADLLGRVLQSDLLAEDVVQKLMRYRYAAGQREAALRVYEAFRLELARELDLEPLEETEQLAALIAGAQPLEPQPLRESPNKIPLTVQRPPQLIGREDALAQLLQRSRPVVLVGGEPGVGKTRLVSDAAPDALYLRCLEGLEEVPYFPLVNHLRDNLATLPELGMYADELARLVPEVAPGRSPAPADPTYGKVRMLEAWTRYLSMCASQGAPFGVFLDDIQWADASTLELLVYLAGQGTLRVVATYRSTEVRGHFKRTLESLEAANLATTLALEPLSDEAVTRLVASLSSQQEGPPLFSRWLYERTGGNPFFMLETLKALFEAGLVSEAGESWQSQVDDVTQDYSELEVPAAVAAVVQRRVRSLSQETQRVLPVAAVIREGFTPELLSRLTGLSPGAVVEVLDEAERGGLIDKTRFSHDLLRESLYDTLTSSRRSFLHGQVAALSAAPPGVVAEHWLAAGNSQKAVAVWSQAARALSRRGLDIEARPLLERALSYAEGDLKPRVQAQLAYVFDVLGEGALAEPLVEAVLRGATDPSIRAAALDIAAALASKRGKLEQAAALIQEAIGLIDESDENWDSVRNEYGGILLNQGKFEAARDVTETELARLEKKPPSRYYLTHLQRLAILHEEQGQLEQAVQLYYQVIQKAREWQDIHSVPMNAGNLLGALVRLGRPEEALPLGEEMLALDLPRSDGLRFHLAKAYTVLERYAEARALLSHLTEHATLPVFKRVAWARLVGLHHLTNDTPAFEAALERTLQNLEVTTFPVSTAIACIAVLEFGDRAQKERLRPALASLDWEPLPRLVREDLERTLAQNPDFE